MKNINSLINEYKQGNKEVFAEIEKLESRQIHDIIKGFSRYGIEDLYNVGIIGLLKAIDLFDETKNVKFNTFAYNCIRNEVYMELRKNRKFADNISMSIDEQVNDTEDCSLLNALKSDVDIEEEVIGDYMTTWLYATIKDFGKKNKIKSEIMYCILKEQKQKDIAEKFGVSRGYVAKLNSEFIKFGKEKAKLIA